MIPVIAIVGRPNVGKSTLFNRLTKSRDAIVAEYAGLTRDRQYGLASYQGRSLMLVDTGGITGEEVGIDAAMLEQSLAAIREADTVLLLVDAHAGVTAVDESLAIKVRKLGKKCVLVINKIDKQEPQAALAEFSRLGFEQVLLIAAAHGRGVNSIFTQVFADFPKNKDEQLDVHSGIKLAIVGRPNVGKSTLVNRMLGEERVIVYDQPGTTRDSIYIPFKRAEQEYTLIDTAGIRRRGKIALDIEKFSVIKTMQAINDANVVIMVIDASEGLVDHDLNLLGMILEAGRALVIAFNKWDGLESSQKQFIKDELSRRLVFVDFADMHFISALHGSGVGKLYASVDKAFNAAMMRFAASKLTDILLEATKLHQPPLVNGRRIKLRYMHLGGVNPPLFIVHGNQTHAVPKNYSRYLENTLRRVLHLKGTPIRIEYKSGDNPYANQKNQLSKRQVNKKRRLMAHVKKRK